MLAEKLVQVFPYTGVKNSNEFFGQPNPCWKYCSPKGNTFKSMGIYWASWYKKTSAGKVWWIRGQIQCGVPAGETGQKKSLMWNHSWFGASLVAQMVKKLPALQKTGLDPWVGKIPWRKEWLLTPVFWPGEFHACICGVTKSQTWPNNFHFTSSQRLCNDSLATCNFPYWHTGFISHSSK